MNVCVSGWVTLLYSRKLTEHYKPAMTEQIKLKNYIWTYQGLFSRSRSINFDSFLRPNRNSLGMLEKERIKTIQSEGLC